MSKPFIRVLGSADWHQTKRNDHSCYTVSDKILVDACSNVVQNLLEQDVDPVEVSTICFTHLHADHDRGLAPLLLYWRVRKGSFGEMTIIGPKATVRAAFERALNYVFYDSRDLSAEVKEMPTIIEIDGEGSYEIPGFQIGAIDADHAVPALCYRFTHQETGLSAGFTGDTRYLPQFGAFFRKVDWLVHEVSFGASPLGPSNELCRHSSVYEAVQVCREADARRLMLTHTYEPKREAALEEARKRVNVPVEWAMPYHTFDF